MSRLEMSAQSQGEGGAYNPGRLVEKFDHYQLLRFTEPQPSAYKRRVRRGQWMLLGIVAVSFVAAYAIYNLQRAKDMRGAPFAYLEIKAIDPDGRPVAGAQVMAISSRSISSGQAQASDLAQIMGVTDSYGEWRRFMRVELGRQISFNIQKSSDKESLQGLKSINVPESMPAHGDLELIGRVQLNRVSHSSIAKTLKNPSHSNSQK